MTKINFTFLAWGLMLSSSAHASDTFNLCESKFTDAFTLDSKAFTTTISNEEIVGPSTRINEARAAILKISRNLGCSDEGLALTAFEEEQKCTEVVPGNPFSVSCYVEAKVGYFFVTKDLLENIHVIYNRWD
jgi:hypothetical protein